MHVGPVRSSSLSPLLPSFGDAGEKIVEEVASITDSPSLLTAHIEELIQTRRHLKSIVAQSLGIPLATGIVLGNTVDQVENQRFVLHREIQAEQFRGDLRSSVCGYCISCEHGSISKG